MYVRTISNSPRSRNSVCRYGHTVLDDVDNYYYTHVSDDKRRNWFKSRILSKEEFGWFKHHQSGDWYVDTVSFKW